MKLIFLGTGAGIPSKQRNVTSIVLEMSQELGNSWMFDCGEATQHQILHTNVRPRKVDKIFITHLHGDHIYGLPGFLSSRSFQGGESPVTIYGPAGIEEFVKTSLGVSGTKLSYPLLFSEVFEGLLLEDEQFQVFAKKLDHGIPSYGYRIVEKDRPGQLLAEKLMAKGIEPGPIYQKIKENSVVTLENGQQILRQDFIGPNKPGKIVTICGDTRYFTQLQEFVDSSDILVYESTFNAESEELASKYYHSTTKQAAELANKSDVKRLILTHISSRYQGEQQEELLNEARVIFDKTDMAFDFYETDI